MNAYDERIAREIAQEDAIRAECARRGIPDRVFDSHFDARCEALENDAPAWATPMHIALKAAYWAEDRGDGQWAESDRIDLAGDTDAQDAAREEVAMEVQRSDFQRVREFVWHEIEHNRPQFSHNIACLVAGSPKGDDAQAAAAWLAGLQSKFRDTVMQKAA